MPVLGLLVISSCSNAVPANDDERRLNADPAAIVAERVEQLVLRVFEGHFEWLAGSKTRMISPQTVIVRGTQICGGESMDQAFGNAGFAVAGLAIEE